MAEKLEDLNLPNAPVLKIIKGAIPESVAIGKDARIALARAASVFVLYITSHATQVAQKVNRKTLIGQDIIDALEALEFEEFVKPLTECLAEYKDSQKLKREKGNKAKKNLDEEDEEEVEHVEDNDDDEEIEEEKEEDSA